MTGFQQLRSVHKIMLPKLTADKQRGYFIYWMIEERRASVDIKTFQKGKKKYLRQTEVLPAAFIRVAITLSGIVGAVMRRMVP